MNSVKIFLFLNIIGGLCQIHGGIKSVPLHEFCVRPFLGNHSPINQKNPICRLDRGKPVCYENHPAPFFAS